MTHIIDSDYVFHDGETYGKQLIIEHTQEIPESFIDRLKAQRAASSEGRMGDFHQVASIPSVIYEQWLRDGYDISKEPISKTVAKLKAESLDVFLTTDKRV